MGKYLDMFFNHEVGNKHMKMYSIYSNWAGLTRKSVLKHTECWPMFITTAIAGVATIWYLYRLSSQPDAGVNRFDKRVHKNDIQESIMMASHIDYKKINPQSKMPHLGEYKMDY